MTRQQTGRRNGDTPLRRLAGRLYADALQRAELRRRALAVSGRFPTVAVAIELDELELLLADIDRGRRLWSSRPARLDPLIAELRMLLEGGRRTEAAGGTEPVPEPDAAA